MTVYQPLAKLSKPLQLRLQAAPRSDIESAIVAEFEAWQRRGRADIDELPFAGAMVGRLDIENADQCAYEWAGGDASSLKLEIVADFLWGYWPFSRRVHEPMILELLSALLKLPRHSDAYGSVMLALASGVTVQQSTLPSTQIATNVETMRTEIQILRETGLQAGVLGTIGALFQA